MLLLVSCGQSSTDTQVSGALNPDGTPVNGSLDGTAGGNDDGTGKNADGTEAGVNGTNADGTGDAKPGDQGPSAEELEAERLRKLVLDSPRIEPANVVSKSSVTVTLNVESTESKIYYTLDGSNPGSGKGTLYKGPFAVSASSQVKTVAVLAGAKDSKISEGWITIDEICVAAGGQGNGGRNAPLPTLSAAVALAKENGIRNIKVAQGELRESVELSDVFTFTGGWDAGFSKQGSKRTLLKATAMEGPGKKNPGYALKVKGPGANGLVFKQFEFRGPEASYSSGILVEGAEPRFVDCASHGGEASYGYGAVVIGNGAPVFEFCELDGGDGASGNGISIDSARAVINNSYLSGGKGTITGAGAIATDGRIQAASSVFAGNSANTGYGVALYNSKGSKFDSCTLWGGSGRDATALFISNGNPALGSSIVASGGSRSSYGIYDNYGDSAPSSLKNLVFSGCTSGLYWDADTKTAYININPEGVFMTEAGKLSAGPKAPASLVESLALSAEQQYRTPSNAGPGLTEGGLALAGGPVVDRTGKARTEPWSIGAFEIDHK